MGIIKNEIPILEYDDDKSAVIMPTHENLNISLPRKAVFAFLGDLIDRYAAERRAERAAEFVSATKTFPIYVTEYRGEKVCLAQAPVGAAPSAQILDWLIGHDVREIVSAGSCGVLTEEAENVFLVPCRALRDEGTSYHYLAPARYINVNRAALAAIEAALRENGLRYREVTSWSTDGFYRETREKVAYRVGEGCSVVEMECSALAACAELRGAVWGEILFTADTLADAEHYDERNWGSDSPELALKLCFDAVLHLS